MPIFNIEEINFYKIAQELEDSIVFSKGFVSNMITTISVIVSDEVIFQYNPDFNTIIYLKDSYREELEEVFKMSISNLHQTIVLK